MKSFPRRRLRLLSPWASENLAGENLRWKNNAQQQKKKYKYNKNNDNNNNNNMNALNTRLSYKNHTIDFC